MILRSLVALTLASTLLAPLAATAQTPPPATPTAPAAPTTPATPPASKHNNRVRGKISAVDTAKKTLTVTSRRGDVTLSVPDDAKIYKIGDTKDSPTGTFGDLAVDTMITAQTDGDATAPVAKTIYLRAPKNTTSPTPPAP